MINLQAYHLLPRWLTVSSRLLSKTLFLLKYGIGEAMYPYGITHGLHCPSNVLYDTIPVIGPCSWRAHSSLNKFKLHCWGKVVPTWILYGKVKTTFWHKNTMYERRLRSGQKSGMMDIFVRRHWDCSHQIRIMMSAKVGWYEQKSWFLWWQSYKLLTFPSDVSICLFI